MLDIESCSAGGLNPACEANAELAASSQRERQTTSGSSQANRERQRAAADSYKVGSSLSWDRRGFSGQLSSPISGWLQTPSCRPPPDSRASDLSCSLGQDATRAAAAAGAGDEAGCSSSSSSSNSDNDYAGGGSSSDSAQHISCTSPLLSYNSLS
jgi:hypothetical protein